MKKQSHEPIVGQLVDENTRIHVTELCHICHIEPDFIIEMVEFGILEPEGDTSENWQFRGPDVYVTKTVLRLQRDLEVNLSGAAVIVQMMEEVEELRQKIRWLEQHL